MTAFLWAATAATMIGSVFVASARYWWRSAHVPFEIDSPTAFMSGAPVPILRHLERYLQQVGRLNARAAICGAIAVTCSTGAALIGLWSSVPSASAGA
jgi:hypothetical protein